MDNISNSPNQLPIWDTVTTAWNKVYGAKASFWAALAILFFITSCLSCIQSYTKNSIFSFIIHQIVSYLLETGIVYIGIVRATDAPISYKLIYRVFEKDIFLRLIGLCALQLLILLPALFIFIAIDALLAFSLAKIAAAMIISVLVALYLVISLSLSTGFILDKRYNPWQAIKSSFKATQPYLLNILAILLIQLGAIIGGTLLLGIGLIWALPFGYITYGLVYHRLSQGI